MATITVLKLDSDSGAENMLGLVKELAKKQLIALQDVAIVSWPMGKNKPKTRQLENVVGVGALDGSFWGLLFGLIFFAPLLGMTVGGGLRALTGSFADVGIDDSFIKAVREKVTEGTSALFIVTSDVVLDQVMKALDGGPDFELIASHLSRKQEEQLKAAFVHE